MIEPPSGLVYDAESQRPSFNGARVPGVTDVLKLSGIADTMIYGSDHALWCGQARHAAVELWIKGTLVLESLHPDIEPSLEAFLDFQDKTGFMPTHSELKVWHPAYRVATKIDLLGEFPDKSEAIIELKSGTIAKPTAIQTALQDILLDAQKTRKRFGLSIPKTGKPNIVPYTNREDYSIAYSALNIAAWKMKELGIKL